MFAPWSLALGPLVPWSLVLGPSGSWSLLVALCQLVVVGSLHIFEMDSRVIF